MWKTRYALYAIVIVVAVSGAFAALVWVPGINRFQVPLGTGHAQNQARKPWAPTAELDAEANANFAVEASRPGNAPSAGQHAGSDWPQFAGSHRDNRSPETGLLSQWRSNGPSLAWISRGLGTGFSSVSVVDGVVYTMGNKGQSECVIALDAGTGQKIWATPIAWATHPSGGEGPRSTPTVSHDKVYALGAAGDLACLEANTGKICWQTNIVDEYGSQVPGFGICESVLADADRVICTPGGMYATLVALNAQDGHLLWKSLVPQRDHPAYASAIVVEAGGGGVRQYVQLTAEGTIGVRADDGQFLWRDDSAANPQANCSSPLAVGNLVFSSSNYGVGGSLVRLVANQSKFKPELVYHTHEMSSHHGGMVILDGLLYGSSGTGVLTCLDLQTGKVKWKNRSVGKGSVTCAEGRIYLRSEEGPVALVDAQGTGYRELGRLEQPQRSKSPAWSYPVVAEGKLLLRDQDLLLCYDLRPKK